MWSDGTLTPDGTINWKGHIGKLAVSNKGTKLMQPEHCADGKLWFPPDQVVDSRIWVGPLPVGGWEGKGELKS